MSSAPYILRGLQHAGGALYSDYMEKRAMQLPLSWFMKNDLSALGAILGGLGTGGRRAHQLHGLTGSSGAMKKVRDLAGEGSRLEAGALSAGSKYKPTWEHRVAGREAKFLDAMKDKTLKGNPLDVLKAYLPEVAAQGAQGAISGAALGKLGDTLLAIRKRKKMMELAKNVGVPAGIGVGTVALLND